MWGTTPPCVKLTGDSGNGFEAALIGDCRLFRLFAENYSAQRFGTFATQSANNGRSFRLDRLVGEHDKRRRDRESSAIFGGKALHRRKRRSVRHRLPKN
jgi:hypothetical protein